MSVDIYDNLKNKGYLAFDAARNYGAQLTRLLREPEVNTFNELRNAYCQGIFAAKALLIQEEPIRLRSGGSSHVFLDHRHFLAQHQYLSLVAELYCTLLAQTPTGFSLGVVESVMSPVIVGAMAKISGHDIVIVKSKKLDFGTKESVFGDVKRDIVLIDDMTSTGSTIIETAALIRQLGGEVKAAVVSACRDNQAALALENCGIKLHSIASFAEILQYLLPQLSQRQRELVSAEYPNQI